MSFASMHNDYLDPDRHNNSDDHKPATGGWHLYLLDKGEKTLLGTYTPDDGADVMGCDMHEWMVEQRHYGEHDPDKYEWDGDGESVAVMAQIEGMREFIFEWDAAWTSPV